MSNFGFSSMKLVEKCVSSERRDQNFANVSAICSGQVRRLLQWLSFIAWIFVALWSPQSFLILFQIVSGLDCGVILDVSSKRLSAFLDLIIPVTRRVKGYTRFVGKYVTGRRKRFRPHKVYIFLIKITSRVDLAMSVCPSVRMNAEISETMRVTILGLGTQIPEIPAQRKFVSRPL